MSENSPPYGTGANSDANSDLLRAVPYAEQQIRALCLLAAVITWTKCPECEPHCYAVDYRKWIAEGRWDA